jgi:hypothetical protein
VAERSGDTAFARAGRQRTQENFRPHESGGKRAALQTLRAVRTRLAIAKRLEYGGFSTAFARA